MKKFVYCYYDKDVEAFGTPQFNELTPAQFTEGLSVGIKRSKDITKLAVYDGLVLYLLGTYEDENAEFNLDKPQKLLDLDELLKARYAKEEAKQKDGE